MTALELSAADIEALINAPEDRLLAQLGQARGRGAVGKDAIEQGREIYGNLRNAVKGAICKSDRVRAAHVGAKASVSPILLAAVADVIAGYLTGISAASFVVLLLREGIGEYCAEEWSTKEAG
jgi:hypothetical protein